MTFIEQTISTVSDQSSEEQRAFFFRIADLIMNSVARDIPEGAYDGRIRKTPGVCGGSARIRDHRLPVWGVIEYLRLGRTDEEVLESYPFIDRNDLEAAKEYYRDRKLEIDLEIAINEMV